MSHYLIGLTGRAGAGKDSCADVLARHGYKRIALADAVRSEIAYAWGIDTRVLTDRDTKDRPLPSLAVGNCQDPGFLRWAVYVGHNLYDPRSPRWLMQRYATEYRRRQDPLYWVRIVAEWICRQRASGYRHLVVTDVRLPNEAEAIALLGGSIVRVHRPDLPPMEADTADHSSEQHGELPVDADINNDGSLDALVSEVEKTVYLLYGADALPQLEAAHGA